MSALATLAVISLLFIALGAVMLLAACDRFMKQAQRERDARFLERWAGVGATHGDRFSEAQLPPADGFLAEDVQ